MTQRSSHKEVSRQKILNAGAARLRKEGLSGAGVGAVMKDAGLTHGAFYAHFDSKEDMLISAFKHALAENRPRWTGSKANESWPDRLELLAERYLVRKHRDDLSTSCALAALLSEAARSSDRFRRSYEEEFLKSIDSICGENPCDPALQPRKFEEAIAFFALCAGGLSLSRAVEDKEFSDQILSICKEAAGRISAGGERVGKNSGRDCNASASNKNQTIGFDLYPMKSYDKIRYADTDRQGHVNNAVFSTMIETGRVEVLYNQKNPLAAPDCSFVIASQKLDFLSQLTWPSRVDIGSRVLKVNRSSLILETALFKEDGSCAAISQTVIVQVNDDTRRSFPFSSETKKYLQTLMLPAD